ncbi:MAG: 5-formyltetrahydrofolate cyclo-ligase [Propionibacteriaceae bacterium]|jgi:5-formyltetrahydrofolate cyclo-ligase|nr:5-formyltetrahydrofolate cyclo-ligase [Propionibacteriaceae bacterium]
MNRSTASPAHDRPSTPDSDRPLVAPSRSDDDRSRLKAGLRAVIRRQRHSLTVEQRRQLDLQRTEHVRVALATLELPPCPTVAIYWSVGTEPGTLDLGRRFRRVGWRILLPVLSPGEGGTNWNPAWGDWTGPVEPPPPGVVGPSWRGLRQPATTKLDAAALGQADLIIVPGMAATAAGTRLGRGGGWYDRALLHARPTTPRWVLLNEAEVLGELPMQAWDQPVDAIVTPSGLIVCAPRPEAQRPAPPPDDADPTL